MLPNFDIHTCIKIVMRSIFVLFFVAITINSNNTATSIAPSSTKPSSLLFSSPGRSKHIIPHAKSRQAGIYFLNTANRLLDEDLRGSAQWAVLLALDADLTSRDRKKATKLRIQLKRKRSTALKFYNTQPPSKSMDITQPPSKSMDITYWLEQIATLIQMGHGNKAIQLLLSVINDQWILAWENITNVVNLDADETDKADETIVRFGTLARQGRWIAEKVALIFDTKIASKYIFVVTNAILVGFEKLKHKITMSIDMQLPIQCVIAQALDMEGKHIQAAETFPFALVEQIINGDSNSNSNSKKNVVINVDGTGNNRQFEETNPIRNEVMKHLLLWRSYPRWCRRHGRKEYGPRLKLNRAPSKIRIKAGWSSEDENDTDTGTELIPQHVLRVDARILSTTKFHHYVTTGQPIILTNLKPQMLNDYDESYTSDESMFWTKQNIIKKFGTHLVSICNSSQVLPLQSFGRHIDGSHFLRDTMEMKEFIEQHMFSKNKSDDPLYLFGPSALSEIVSKHLHIPHLFSDGIFTKDMRLRQRDILMTLGGKGSGIWLHAHTTAWNFLIFGRRQWFMIPPGKYSGPRFASIDDALSGKMDWNGLKKYGMTFIQEEGEVVFIPNGWIHGTRNLTPVVGIASEIGYEASRDLKGVLRDLFRVPSDGVN